MYIDLKDLVKQITSEGVTLEVENRNRPKYNDYGFPKNHVEVLNYRNAADTDFWDGLVLGYNNLNLNYGERYHTNNIIGVILINNGNHKLIFKIPEKEGFSEALLETEITTFMNNYKSKWIVKMAFLNKSQMMNYLYPEIKKTYTLQPVYKKSTCEEQDWRNTLSSGESVLVKVSNVYRWGTFTIELTDKERDALLEMEEVRLDNYEHELIEMWDGGCDFWIDVVDRENYTPEQQEEIDSLLYGWKGGAPEDEDEDDDGYSYEKMEHNGWNETDCHIILGQCELTLDSDTSTNE